MITSKFLSRKGVCSKGLKKPSTKWTSNKIFFDKMNSNKQKHPIAHARAEKWVLENKTSSGIENKKNYFKKFAEYLKDKKKTYYLTEQEYNRGGYLARENINDLFEEFDNPSIQSLIVVELMSPKKWDVTFCDLDLDKESPQCGKLWCNDYKPLNGVNGRCKNLIPSLIETGHKYKISREKGVEEI